MFGAPDIPFWGWAIFAVASTVFYWLIFIPAMPVRKYKIRAAGAPVLGIFFIAISSLVKHDGFPLSVALYAVSVSALTISFLGRTTELKAVASDLADNGHAATAAFSKAALLQIRVTLVIAIVGGAWLTLQL